MTLLNDKAEVIISIDIEGIFKGGVGQLGIGRQIFTCDGVIEFNRSLRLGKEQAEGRIFVVAARCFEVRLTVSLLWLPFWSSVFYSSFS